MATTVIPDASLLVDPDPTSLVRPDGRPGPEFRTELRRIPSLRNAWSVAFLWASTFAIIWFAVWWNHPIGWVAAFLLMGAQNARFAILMHEAAHRLLFRNRRANDFVGRWLLGFPVFAPTDLYRRGHMAHHRDEFGPDEPDIPLYAGYPIGRDSMRRKLTRDALGLTGLKLMRGLARGLRVSDAKIRRQAWSILAVQLVLLALCVAWGHPWVYLFLWLLPHLTAWRVINRLRSIAEHGGMQRSDDRRETTHSVRQSWLPRFWMVPYNTGWHLAHHVDSGIPFRALPRLHRELVDSGYVQPGLEYRNYTSLWRTLASGPTSAERAAAVATSADVSGGDFPGDDFPGDDADDQFAAGLPVD